MPDIPLREYLNRIEDWIRSADPDRAITHGRHILTYYPECIWVHRILGEAYLDKGLLAEARDSFGRTLDADPENAIAHISLSLTYDRLGMLPEAIWHMERAFDVASGNAEVRTELTALYLRRGDSRSAGPALTRGAMARVYAHNGLLERAIAEYQEALRQNPGLLDARAGLAEAQWRAGLGQEALESCRLLLEQLPGCLKALLILGQRLLVDNQEAEAEAALAEAQALDPENRLAQAMMGDLSPLAPTELFIPELAVKETRVAGHEEDTMTEAEKRTGTTRASPGKGECAPEDETLRAEAQVSRTQQAEDTATEGEGLPEWLRESPPADAPAAVPAGEEAGEEPAPEWMESWSAGRVAEPEAQTRAEEVEPPAWLGTLGELAAAGEEPILSEPAAEDEAAPKEMVAEEAEAPNPEAASPAGVVDAVPDWVRRMEEAVTDERVPAGAGVLRAAGAAATTASALCAGGSAQERQRIRELTFLLHQEPGKYWARIELARMCCRVGDWDGALLQYEELIAGHKLIRAVTLDLQGLLQEETDRVQVYRLLGDAFMESDQIDQALEMYRLARQILRKR